MPKPSNPAATPAVLARRRRWKEAEARAVLAAFAASGSSLTEFARVEGLEPERLRRSGARSPPQHAGGDLAHRPLAVPPRGFSFSR
jgi:hypothetical protein